MSVVKVFYNWEMDIVNHCSAVQCMAEQYREFQCTTVNDVAVGFSAIQDMNTND